jgi:hypothetical protein
VVDTDFNLAKIAYGEVLDATKHQDDKIGRFITAIAFLTAATVAFANRGVLDVQYRMGNAELPLVAVATGVFLATVGLAALFFILSLSTPLTLPQAVTTSSSTSSRLYFRQIARQSASEWAHSWTVANQEEEVAKQYVEEAYNIALRADLKYQRQLEGTALFAVGVIAFVVVALLSVDALANRTGVVAGRPMLNWSANRAWMLATPLALATMIVNYQSRQNRRQFHRGGVPFSTINSVVYAGLVALVAVPVKDPELRSTAVAMVMSMLIVVAPLIVSLTVHDVIHGSANDDPPPTTRLIVRRVLFTQLPSLPIVLAGGALGAVSISHQWPHWQLLSSTVLVAALMIPTLSASWFTAQKNNRN